MKYGSRHRPYNPRPRDTYYLGFIDSRLREYIQRYLRRYLREYLSSQHDYKPSRPYRRSSLYETIKPVIGYNYPIASQPSEKYKPVPREKKTTSFPIMPRERVYKTENNRLLEAIYNEKLLENTRTIKNLENKISELQELLKDSFSRQEDETSNLEEESGVELEPTPTQDLEEPNLQEENAIVFKELEKRLYDLPEVELNPEVVYEPLEEIDEPSTELLPDVDLKKAKKFEPEVEPSDY